MKIQILILYLSALLLIQTGIFAQTPVYNPSKAIGSFLGTHARERVGYWINPAGDVNGDGYDDFLIANYHTNVNGYDAGATYLILGKAQANWAKSVSLSQADARFLGDSNYSALGYHVDGGGDVNGDGLSDIILGAPAGNEDGKDRPGSAYIIFGRTTANWGFQFVPENSADASYEGEVDYDQYGKSVAIVGDVNNDGYDDILVGAPFSDGYATNGGKAYLVLGKANGWVTHGKIAQYADASFRSSIEADEAGYMVSGAGDVNGDGCDDFLIGAPGKGNAYLVFGRIRASWGLNFNLSSADVIFSRPIRTDNSGWIVASAGDVNHDGFSDILITAPYNNENGTSSGKTYLVLGHSGTWTQKYDISLTDASFLGEAASDNSGWSASGIGDINADGFDDFMIGAWYNDQAGQDAGKAYIIYGKSSGWQRNVNLATVSDFILGENPINYMGFSVSAAGDVNQDGVSDFIVSASYSNEAFEWGGKIYVFLGERPKFPISGNISYYSNAAPVPEVSLQFSGTVADSVFTDAQGNYSWTIPDGRNVTLRPWKARGADQGFMTILSYDAALVARRAVGLETFSAAQSISADVDGDDKITTFDASLIAQYVVDQHPVAEIANWVFDPDARVYSNISATLTHQNFSAIIVGNVHGGWTPPGQLGKERALPELAKPTFRIDGDVFTFPVCVPVNTELLALDLQLGFNSEKLEFVGINKATATRDFSLFHRVGHEKLTVSLFGVQPANVDSVVAEIQFKIIGNGTEAFDLTFTRFVVNTQAYQPWVTSVTSAQNIKSATFALEQNYPNPFNPATTILYGLPQRARVQISVYNLMGQEILTLIDGIQPAGTHQLHWNGKDRSGKEVAAGIYLYKAILGKEVKIRRMVKLM
jgi:hypothetical protein